MMVHIQVEGRTLHRLLGTWGTAHLLCPRDPGKEWGGAPSQRGQREVRREAGL